MYDLRIDIRIQNLTVFLFILIVIVTTLTTVTAQLCSCPCACPLKPCPPHPIEPWKPNPSCLPEPVKRARSAGTFHFTGIRVGQERLEEEEEEEKKANWNEEEETRTTRSKPVEGWDLLERLDGIIEGFEGCLGEGRWVGWCCEGVGRGMEGGVRRRGRRFLEGFGSLVIRSMIYGILPNVVVANRALSSLGNRTSAFRPSLVLSNLAPLSSLPPP
ncbi:hypothetical protein DFH27DRAFT_638432 [Peziza echinospora]|nr:hypothetical protein DFH27DRAFT_638432 [Peziza echinospora]